MGTYANFYNSDNGDRIYDAEAFAEWLKPFFKTGVFNNELQVVASSGMNVVVKSGNAYIEGKLKKFDNETTLALEPASSTVDRIDAIVVRRNDTERDFTIEVIKGSTNAPQPVREGGIYDIVLAHIAVPMATTEITQTLITDTRMNMDICGWVVSNVEEVDFNQISAQFSTYLAQFEKDNLQEFTDWFNLIKGQLTTDQAGALWTAIEEVKDNVQQISAEVDELQATKMLPEIIVKTKQAETLTCTCDSTVLTGTTVDNTYKFKVPFYGTWVIKDSTEKLTQTIEVNTVKQYEAHIGYILGIKKDKTSSSPQWERTDDSIGLNATASIGSTKGQSDFDNIDIYKGIYRYTKDTGDVVVRVPKFYYKRYFEGNTEFIKIADKQFDGFKVHPAFKKGDTEIDYFEVGAYKTTAGHFSKSGLAPLVNLTRDSFRTFAKVKGTGWGIIDIATVSAIQMLILVEYANNNSQSIIGSGNCSTNAAIVTGTTDSMYNEGNHTGRASGTDSAVNCIWRGIESFWGNVWEFTDGLNYNNGKYLICNKPQYYADDTDNQYTELAYTLPTGLNNTFIKELGYDANEDWCMMPTATGGDANTYITDAVWSNTGWRILLRGGDWDDGSSDGLFASYVYFASSDASAAVGSRLLFLPL